MNVFDKESLNIIAEITSGFTNIQLSATTEDYCHYDLVGKTKSGKIFIIEGKGRNVTSNTYWDNTIELFKYNELKKITDVETIYIISNFTDNVLFINKLNDKHSIKTVNAKKTTCFDKNKKVSKQFVSYQPSTIIKYKIENNKISIINKWKKDKENTTIK